MLLSEHVQTSQLPHYARIANRVDQIFNGQGVWSAPWSQSLGRCEGAAVE